MNEMLSTEQLCLLENLMYLDYKIENKKKHLVDEHKTVGRLISAIDINKVNADEIIPKEEWSKLIQAVKKDSVLMGMEIVSTKVDNGEGGGEGFSAVFTNPYTNEAVVAFRGTAKEEWKDNFLGGGVTNQADKVSTPQQENALKWYQDWRKDNPYYMVTVTGHSKGGNKAKYITIMDDSVERCVSFDGQGFSDEFIEHYTDKISTNQYKISNHNVKGDYVNILLNDVGRSTYYEAYNIGKKGFLENHAPNAFLHFQKDSTAVMVESSDGQIWEVKEMDQYFHSLLRGAKSAGQKESLLSLFGTVADKAMGEGTKDVDTYLRILIEEEKLDAVAYLLAYTSKYIKEKPEFSKAVASLAEFDKGSYIAMIEGIDKLNVLFENSWVDIPIEWFSENPPKALLSWIQKELNSKGIQLSTDEIAKLLKIIKLVNEKYDRIADLLSGEEKRVADKPRIMGKSRSGFGKNCRFEVRVQGIDSAGSRMEDLAKQIVKIADQLEGFEFGFKIDTEQYYKQALNKIALKLKNEGDFAKNLSKGLKHIARLYQSTEKRVLYRAEEVR